MTVGRMTCCVRDAAGVTPGSLGRVTRGERSWWCRSGCCRRLCRRRRLSRPCVRHAQGQSEGRESGQAGLEALAEGHGEAGRLPPGERAALRRPDAFLADRRAQGLDLDGERPGEGACEVPEAPLNDDPVDFLGVDLGIVSIATTSDGEIMAGRELNRVRIRERKPRTKLQKKNTPSARRRLKKRRRKGRGGRGTSITRSRSMWWPRQNAPVAESPWKTSRASVSGYGFASPNGAPTPAGPSPSCGSSSRTRPAGQGCRWCKSIRRAATSTRHPGSRAGTADSLITQTGTAPATSARERGSCGDAGPRQRPPPQPRDSGAVLDANAASPPVMSVVQTQDFGPGSLTYDARQDAHRHPLNAGDQCARRRLRVAARWRHRPGGLPGEKVTIVCLPYGESPEQAHTPRRICARTRRSRGCWHERRHRHQPAARPRRGRQGHSLTLTAHRTSWRSPMWLSS